MFSVQMNHKMDADSGLVSLDSLPQMVLKEVADRALDTNHLVFGNVFNGRFSLSLWNNCRRVPSAICVFSGLH